MDGIAGIYSLKQDNDLVRNMFKATGACQHRGKASAGIAVATKKGISIHKGLGRIGEVAKQDILQIFQNLEPIAAIGNVGYTKNKIAEERNAEPIKIYPKFNSEYDIALTMDGYLVKENDLKSKLEEDYSFETGNKTEVVGALLHKYITENGLTFEAGKQLVDNLHGRATFSLIALVNHLNETYMICLNDDKAFEPFCYGIIDDAFVASSESCSHRRLGGFAEREYSGAEMTILSPKDGIATRKLRNEVEMPDIFQAIYFGSVGSNFRGKDIFQIRRQIGWKLVDYYKDSKADIVIPNPESGWGVSVGIAEKLEKPTYPALIKQAQAVRTFQEGEAKTRKKEVGLKFGGIDSLLVGKKVVMGDDSIVRGSVSEGGSVWTVYNCGAEYLEFWVSYGAMLFPSFKEWYRGKECLDELAVQRAFKGDNPYNKSLDEINKAVAKLIKVDEVKYNTKELIEKITGAGSFQALDASYPISEEFWPDWLKEEVEKFHRFK